jgi:hypothetical protein
LRRLNVPEALLTPICSRHCRRNDRMVVLHIFTYASKRFTTKDVRSIRIRGVVYSMQLYVITFLSNLWKASNFLGGIQYCWISPNGIIHQVVNDHAIIATTVSTKTEAHTSVWYPLLITNTLHVCSLISIMLHNFACANLTDVSSTYLHLSNLWKASNFLGGIQYCWISPNGIIHQVVNASVSIR